MTPFQSQRTTDLQAEYAANASDLAILQGEAKGIKAKPSLKDDGELRAFLRHKQDEIASIKARQTELEAEIDAAVAEDNSEANLAKRADAFGNIEKVHQVTNEVISVHAQRKDEAFQEVLDKVAHRTGAGHTMADVVINAISTLAPGDLAAVKNAANNALPILRGHSRSDVKALACWIRRIVAAAGATETIAEIANSLSAHERVTFKSVADQNALEVTNHLAQVLTANGIETPEAAPIEFATPADFFKSLARPS